MAALSSCTKVPKVRFAVNYYNLCAYAITWHYSKEPIHAIMLHI
jgi:hypothetical protein